MHDETTLSLDALESALESAHVAPRDPAHEEQVNREQWKSLSKKLGIEGGDRKESERGKGYSGYSLRRWVGIGATAAICCFLAFGGWHLFQGNIATENKVTHTTYTTKSGQRASLMLRDGSQVTLGPATTLQVQNSGGMVVDVTGEALFSVKQKIDQPFTVTAHGITTRVLGTEFVIRAYDASLVRVVVRNGRVSVQSPVVTAVNALVVNSGEGASVASNQAPSVAPITDLAADFAWADGELILANTSINEALIQLSRWYGMEFKVDDESLLQRRVTGTFPASFKKSDMQSLARVIRAQVTVAGNSITFSSTK